MKRLHKLLLKEFSKPLVATFFVALFILIMQFLWKRIDDLVGKGLDFDIILELLIYASATLVPLALPLAVLLSSIMTFGNLGENLELTAIKSSGISLQQFMRPLIIVISMLSIAAFFYSNHVIPYANLKAGSLLYDIKRQRQEFQIREGIFYNDIEGYSIKVGKKNHQTNLLEEIMIYQHSKEKGNAEVTMADSGYIRMTNDETRLLVELYNGQTYKEMEESDKRSRNEPKQYPHQVRKFDKETLLLDLSGFNFTRTDEQLFKDNYQMLKINQLQHNVDSLRKVYDAKANELADKLEKNFSLSQRRGGRPDSPNQGAKNKPSQGNTPSAERQSGHPTSKSPSSRQSDSDKNTSGNLESPNKAPKASGVPNQGAANREGNTLKGRAGSVKQQKARGKGVYTELPAPLMIDSANPTIQGDYPGRVNPQTMATYSLWPYGSGGPEKPNIPLEYPKDSFLSPRILLKHPSGTLKHRKDTPAYHRDSTVGQPEQFNMKRLYDTLPADAKLAILRNALDNARRNNKSISNSRRIFENREKNIYKHQIHWHKKFTLAFACLIFFFIGAPLGSIIRKGGLGTPLVISVVMFIIYYILSITGENFVEKGILPAYLGMWLSSLIFLPIGIFLTYKATNDSVILSPETYLKFIRKLLGRIGPKKGTAGKNEQS